MQSNLENRSIFYQLNGILNQLFLPLHLDCFALVEREDMREKLVNPRNYSLSFHLSICQCTVSIANESCRACERVSEGNETNGMKELNKSKIY